MNLLFGCIKIIWPTWHVALEPLLHSWELNLSWLRLGIITRVRTVKENGPRPFHKSNNNRILRSNKNGQLFVLNNKLKVRHHNTDINNQISFSSGQSAVRQHWMSYWVSWKCEFSSRENRTQHEFVHIYHIDRERMFWLHSRRNKSHAKIHGSIAERMLLYAYPICWNYCTKWRWFMYAWRDW